MQNKDKNWVSNPDDTEEKVIKLVERPKDYSLSNVSHTLLLLDQMKNESKVNYDVKDKNNVKKRNITIRKLKKTDLTGPTQRKELELNKLRDIVSVNRKYALYYDVENTSTVLDNLDDVLNENMSKEKYACIYKSLLSVYKPPVVYKSKSEIDCLNHPNITIRIKVMLDELLIKQRIVNNPLDSIENVINKVLKKLPQSIVDIREKLTLYLPSSGIYLVKNRALYTYLLNDNDELILKLNLECKPEMVHINIPEKEVPNTQSISFYPQTTIYGVLQSIDKVMTDDWKKGRYHLKWKQKLLRNEETLYSYGIKDGETIDIVYDKLSPYNDSFNDNSFSNSLLNVKILVHLPDGQDITVTVHPDSNNIAYLIKKSHFNASLHDTYWNEYGIFSEKDVETWIDDSYLINRIDFSKISRVYLLPKPFHGLREVKSNLQSNIKKRRIKKSTKKKANKVSKKEIAKSNKDINEIETSNATPVPKKRIKLYEIAIEILVPNSKKIAKKVRLSKKETGIKIKSLLQTFMPEGEDINDYKYILPFLGDIEMPEQCTIVPFLIAYMGDKEINLKNRIQLVKVV